jgi:hypothetical protein
MQRDEISVNVVPESKYYAIHRLSIPLGGSFYVFSRNLIDSVSTALSDWAKIFKL